MGAQHHRHILVVHHLHPGDILLHPIGIELILLPEGRRQWMEFCSRLLLLQTHEVMACQAASAIASLRDALKASPLCMQRTLDLRKISAMALNSTRPGCGTSLILYLRAVVMPRCSNRAQSLPVGTGALAPKDSTSSASRYIFSFFMSLGGGCSSLAWSSMSWFFGCYCSSTGEP
jgi:hypothetical protein